MNYTIGELFGGVGGFGLGFERAGFDVKWTVEFDKKCQDVLRYHFPKSHLYKDVKDVKGLYNCDFTFKICDECLKTYNINFPSIGESMMIGAKYDAIVQSIFAAKFFTDDMVCVTGIFEPTADHARITVIPFNSSLPTSTCSINLDFGDKINFILIPRNIRSYFIQCVNGSFSLCHCSLEGFPTMAFDQFTAGIHTLIERDNLSTSARADSSNHITMPLDEFSDFVSFMSVKFINNSTTPASTDGSCGNMLDSFGVRGSTIMSMEELGRFTICPYCGYGSPATTIAENSIHNSIYKYFLPPVDVMTFGFPCQDVSHAGKRKGFVDENGNTTRSGLFYEAVRLLDELKPRVAIFENVLGLLSASKGEDFKSCLEELEKIGFDCTWVTMDSRFFGLAQRRRRVFGLCTRKAEPGVAEGYIREILSQSKSVCGNTAPSPEKGEEAPAHAGDGVEGEGGGAVQSGFDFWGDSQPADPGDGRPVDTGIGSGGGTGGTGGGSNGGVNGYRMVAFGEYATDDTASALKRRDYKDATDLVTEESSAVDARNLNLFKDVSGTLQSKKSGGYSLNYQNPVLVPIDKERVALAIDVHHDKMGGEVSGTLLHHKTGDPSLQAINPVMINEKIEITRESGIGFYTKDDVASPLRARGDDHASTIVTMEQKAEAFQISRGKANEVEVSPTLMAGVGPNRHGTGYSGTDFTAILEKPTDD